MAFCVDGISIIFAGILGISPLTVCELPCVLNAHMNHHKPIYKPVVRWYVCQPVVTCSYMCVYLQCFIESAAGIREGGRTGVTAITVAGYFFLALFFTPIIASVPPYASGPALFLVRSYTPFLCTQ